MRNSPRSKPSTEPGTSVAGLLPTLAGIQAEQARRQRARERERLETDFGAFVRAAWHVSEATTPLVWGEEGRSPLQVVCDHAQALVEDWIRAKLAAMKVLAPLPPAPLPPEGPERDVEVVRRHHLANAWREAKRLGVLEPGGRIRRVPQRFRKLLVNIPPGFAKSRILSVMLPAWAWLRWAGMSWYALSTNPDVALRDADLCRDLVKSPWYRSAFEPWWSFSTTVDAKGRYANSAGGWRASKGWEAKAVGDRADAQVLDDANDPDKAFSEADRRGVNDRWDNTLESRINAPDTSIRIGVQQRVHVGDWSAHVLQEGDWVHLLIQQEKEAECPCKCPSCASGETPLGWRDTRAVGELALPERFGPEYVAAQKKKAMRWAAQHQQRPMVSEGNLFKASWWRFWRYAHEDDVPGYEKRTIVLPDSFDIEELSWDCAFAKTEGSSKVSGGAWGRKGPNKFLLDLVWKQMSFTETCDALLAQVKSRPRVGAKVIEDKANGHAVIDVLRKKVPGLVPFPVSRYGSKESRAAATAHEVEGGNVFIRLHAPWRDEYIAAHSGAPKGDGMDAVDQQSQILLRWGQAPEWDESSFDVGIGPERAM